MNKAKKQWIYSQVLTISYKILYYKDHRINYHFNYRIINIKALKNYKLNKI